MKNINITSGEYFNKFLKNKSSEVFIPFNEAMIQGNLLYPLFDDKFIENRLITHNVDKTNYLKKIKEFIEIKNYINEIELITLWFGKDAFCIINLLVILVYLEDNNYNGKIVLNLVDDYSFSILESNIKLTLGEFKDIYLNLMNNKLIDSSFNFINEGLKDYLYITSNDNFLLDYIKENISKLSQEELIINGLKMTSVYGLGDSQIISMIDKVSKENKKG